MRDERFRQSDRVKSGAIYQRAFKQGTVRAEGCLVVHMVPNEVGRLRLGISIPKRIGNSPVRNRWKRWIRESFRRIQAEYPHAVDIIVRPRLKTQQPSFALVDRSLISILRTM
jgi:ribonuclease P protein component